MSVCKYCNMDTYNGSCPSSPHGHHQHGHGGDKCIFCGYHGDNGSCSYSPDGKHHL